MKKCIFFSKDLLNVMLVYVDKNTVKFDIDGHEVDFDYNLWVDKMRHCLDSRNLYIFNQLMLGYDQKEIGKELGCSHQAISQRVLKIKKILSEKGLL